MELVGFSFRVCNVIYLVRFVNLKRIWIPTRSRRKTKGCWTLLSIVARLQCLDYVLGGHPHTMPTRFITLLTKVSMR